MNRVVRCFLVLASLSALAGPAAAGIISWNDVNGALPGTPTLSPSMLSFTDVNGIVGLNLVITIAPSSQGGSLNLAATNPAPFSGTSVNNARATSGASGNALTFTFNQPVSFVVDSSQHAFLSASEEIRVSSTTALTGSLSGTITGQTITSGPATTITALANGTGIGGGIWTVSSGTGAAPSFTVDYFRRNATDNPGLEAFRINVDPLPPPIPEPTALTLWGIGAVGVFVGGRVRRRS